MRRRGITLLEIMVALTVSLICTLALSMAFGFANRAQRNIELPRQRFDAQVHFEDRMRDLIRRAYFVAPTQEGDPDEGGATSASKTYFIGRTSGGGLGSIGTGTGATELVFTRLGDQPSQAALNSDDDDFVNRNQTFGPVGGMTETCITLQPIGASGNVSGLYLREQTPADTDYEQGGYEEHLDSTIASVSYEFYDGQDWQPDWDTDTLGALPNAVRVTYTLTNDDTSYEFVVKLDNADVLANSSTTTTTTTTGRGSRRSRR